MAQITHHIVARPKAEIPRETVAISVAGDLDESAVQGICACIAAIDAPRSAAVISLDGIISVHWSAICRLVALAQTLGPRVELRLCARQPRVRRLLEALSAA